MKCLETYLENETKIQKIPSTILYSQASSSCFNNNLSMMFSHWDQFVGGHRLLIKHVVEFFRNSPGDFSLL